MKVLVVYYTMNGHTHRLAEAAAEGARQVEGAEVMLRRVPETLSEAELKKRGASDEARKVFSKVLICTPEELEGAEAVIFGTPSYLGNMSGQMRTFLDSLGELWKRNALVGKVGSVFVSSGSQHGGQEAAILSFHPTLLHLGMVIVGLPYSFESQRRIDEVVGGSPYGASTIAGRAGERMPSETELAGARFQGKHVAKIALKLFR
ncbi:MAG TPA: NAD(P)H:quinone oxidoreductase [Methanothrix sp.]|nr:NAD(P)H:quinone oxidoreductase [Methanothrix sp.]HPJ84255.1 NAD(P)H:quinone oxidoreductase [Methanothrix sp.]HPR66373.1 NAD(P)H:quinone oxidoreductase [Methanothrix sp.]